MLFLEDFWKGRITPGEECYRPNREFSFIDGFRYGGKMMNGIVFP